MMLLDSETSAILAIAMVMTVLSVITLVKSNVR